MFVETLTAPINDNTLVSLNLSDLENINNYFEIIYGNKPMRPYIDIDGKMYDINEEDFNNLDLDILNKLQTLNDCSIVSSSKFNCIDKTNIVNKLSYRLTFYNEICKNKTECKNYIREVKFPMIKNLMRDIIDVNDTSSPNSLNVDFSVYRTKGKIRAVNAYKTKYDKSRINKLIKGTIEQTIIYSNDNNMIVPENEIQLETKGEPLLIEPKNNTVSNKKINNIEKKIKKLQEQMENEIDKEQQQRQNVIEEENYENLIDFYNNYFLNDFLNCINIDMLNHSDWVKVVLSYKKCNGDFQDLVEWNKKHKSFDITGLTSIWNQYEIDEIDMSIGTLKHYAKKTNNKKYYNIHKTICKTIELSKTCSEKNLAKLYLHLNSENLYTFDKTFYIFQQGKWNLCDNNNYEVLRYNYSEVLNKYINDIIKNLKLVLKDFQEQNKVDNEIIDKSEQFRKHYNKINEIETITYKTQWINNVVREIRNIMLNNEESEDIFDKKHHLFCFSNTIFDLNTGEQLPFDKKLYITMHSGKYWNEPTDEQVQTIHNLFTSIFPDQDILKCYLSILRTGLSGYRLEKIVVANGNGRNGKGLINELFAFLCGNYYYKLPIDLLTKEVNMIGANPQIANLNNKRFVVCCEPDDGKSIKMHTAKEITGCDTINARGLYQSNTITNLLLTLVIEANKKPELSGRMDSSILERMLDINFVNTFSDNPDLINNIDCFQANKIYKHYEFKKNHYCALFKYILLNAPKDLYVPQNVINRSKEYVVDNEDYYGWFQENYEITNNKDDIIKMKSVFNKYKISEYYMHLTKREKRKNNYKNFCDKTKHHLILKNMYREHGSNEMNCKRLVGVIEKTENYDSDSD